MALTRIQNFQTSQAAALPVLGKLARASSEDILVAVDASLAYPLRMFASSTPDSKLNFAAATVASGDGTYRVTPIQSGTLAATFPASTINFQSGATTGGTFKRSGGTFSLPSTTVGYYRRVGFIYAPAGYIDCYFSAEAVDQASLADIGTFLPASGKQLGYIDLVATGSTAFKSAGAATNIIQNSSIYCLGIPDNSQDKVVANTAIVGATKTKITYDSKGLVTSGADLTESDIPALSISKITNLQTSLDSKLAAPTTFDYTVGAGGQTVFSPAFDILGTSVVTVKVNGQFMRAGASDDYQVDTTANTITFNYSVPQDAQVRIEIA